MLLSFSSAPGEPDNVDLKVISATQLNLTWKSPRDPNGVIIGYRVIWKMVRNDNNIHRVGNSTIQVIHDGDAVMFSIVKLGKGL